MRTSAFPPRRPSHIIRFALPLLLLVWLLYYLSSDNEYSPVPDASLSSDHHAPVLDNINPPILDNIKPPVLDEVKSADQATTEHHPSPPSSGVSDEDRIVPGGIDTTEIGKPEEHSSIEDPASEGDVAKGSSSISHDGIDKDEKGHTDADQDPDDPEQTGSDSAVEGSDSMPTDSTEDATWEEPWDHPIDQLIKDADKTFEIIIAKESDNLNQAAKAYRERRGRHPPPGFDKWFQFAKDNDAIIVEEFFDRIYHDLNPFWGLDPKIIRKEAWDFEMTINIRNQNATAGSDWFWTQIWLKMIKTIEHLLPDMDIALNAMDEPRIVAPWEEVAAYMQKAERTRKLAPVDDVISVFRKLPSPKMSPKKPATREKRWEKTSPFWLIARRGCPPDSAARRTGIVHSFDVTPSFSPEWAMLHQYEGYVSNFSMSTEFCHQPDLQALEGIFIHPLSTSSTKVLFPLFGGSKLATNNEILLPAPMYWNEEDRFTGGGDPGPDWEDKSGPLVWRGISTGGLNQESNWRGFQRHRFVAMSNGTKVALAEDGVESPINFKLPDPTYNLLGSKEHRLGEWISEWADVGFTELMCDPDVEPKPEEKHCPYTDDHFELVESVDLSEQFAYKYLPDIDGNSFSGRYLGFLRSTGLPIKSTMWHEWHDSRLIPWKHFVPMDNRFGDYYGIMEYFLGYGKIRRGHDKAAKKIAMDGKAWAESVLRKEDMQIYVLRLLLEYARLSDDRREKMGWADDILS